MAKYIEIPEWYKTFAAEKGVITVPRDHPHRATLIGNIRKARAEIAASTGLQFPFNFIAAFLKPNQYDFHYRRVELFSAFLCFHTEGYDLTIPAREKHGIQEDPTDGHKVVKDILRAKRTQDKTFFPQLFRLAEYHDLLNVLEVAIKTKGSSFPKRVAEEFDAWCKENAPFYVSSLQPMNIAVPENVYQKSETFEIPGWYKEYAKTRGVFSATMGVDMSKRHSGIEKFGQEVERHRSAAAEAFGPNYPMYAIGDLLSNHDKYDYNFVRATLFEILVQFHQDGFNYTRFMRRNDEMFHGDVFFEKRFQDVRQQLWDKIIADVSFLPRLCALASEYDLYNVLYIVAHCQDTLFPDAQFARAMINRRMPSRLPPHSVAPPPIEYAERIYRETPKLRYEIPKKIKVTTVENVADEGGYKSRGTRSVVRSDKNFDDSDKNFEESRLEKVLLLLKEFGISEDELEIFQMPLESQDDLTPEQYEEKIYSQYHLIDIKRDDLPAQIMVANNKEVFVIRDPEFSQDKLPLRIREDNKKERERPAGVRYLLDRGDVWKFSWRQRGEEEDDTFAREQLQKFLFDPDLEEMIKRQMYWPDTGEDVKSSIAATIIATGQKPTSRDDKKFQYGALNDAPAATPHRLNMALKTGRRTVDYFKDKTVETGQRQPVTSIARVYEYMVSNCEEEFGLLPNFLDKPLDLSDVFRTYAQNIAEGRDVRDLSMAFGTAADCNEQEIDFALKHGDKGQVAEMFIDRAKKKAIKKSKTSKEFLVGLGLLKRSGNDFQPVAANDAQALLESLDAA